MYICRSYLKRKSYQDWWRLVKTDGVPLDISLIIFDSTSAANFQRKMPNTSRLVMAFVMIWNSKSANTMAKNTLYQLQFITSPNDGFYEATIKMKKGIPSQGGDISRIDAYGNQSYCIADKFPLLREYCYYL